MTVRQLFYAADDFWYDDDISIIRGGRVLYKSMFIDVLLSVYAEYIVCKFSIKDKCIEVL